MSNNSKTDKKQEFLNVTIKNVPNKTFLFNDADELVAELNKIVALVPYGTEMRFAFRGKKGELILRRKRDAELKLQQFEFIPPEKKKGKKGGNKQPKSIAGLRIWLKHESRKEYERIVFNPNPDAVGPDELNLWHGFAIEPVKGDYSLMREHLLKNICQDNSHNLHFLMSVLAQMFKEPWRKIGIAIVLIGKMGAGKSKLSDHLGKIIGSDLAPAFDKLEHVTGRFRGHLQNTLLARVEEGHAPTTLEDQSTFKHLITSPTLLVECKGMDAFEAPNFTRFIITSDKDRVAHATAGERRLFVLRVGDGRLKDGAFFKALDQEMENGGAGAFLYDLMHYDYSDVDFSKPPMTDGLQDQTRLAFTPEERWLETVLAEGCLPFKDGPVGWGEVEWPEKNETLTVDKDTVVQSFRDFVPGYRSPATAQLVGLFLAKNIPGIDQVRSGTGRRRKWVFPALEDIRRAFVQTHPGYVFAPDPEPAPETEHEYNDTVVSLESRSRFGRR